MIHLRLITLQGSNEDQEIFELAVPTTAGNIVINEGHAPLLGAIAPGDLIVTHTRGEADSKHQKLTVYSGTVEVLNNVITVLVDETEMPDNKPAKN